MRKFYTSIILIIFLFTNSCDSVRSALGGSKQNSSDEFLVKKKNPLSMPPDYEKLPVPGETQREMISEESNQSEDIKKLLSLDQNTENDQSSNNQIGDIESSILDKIK